jgi:hypothetical protein
MDLDLAVLRREPAIRGGGEYLQQGHAPIFGVPGRNREVP